MVCKFLQVYPYKITADKYEQAHLFRNLLQKVKPKWLADDMIERHGEKKYVTCGALGVCRLPGCISKYFILPLLFRPVLFAKVPSAESLLFDTSSKGSA